MLLPKRTKFRRQHRGRFKGVSKANTIVFGDYGIQALEPVWLTSRQIEATRRSITRYVRRTGKIWIRIFKPSARDMCQNQCAFSQCGRTLFCHGPRQTLGAGQKSL